MIKINHHRAIEKHRLFFFPNYKNTQTIVSIYINLIKRQIIFVHDCLVSLCSHVLYYVLGEMQANLFTNSNLFMFDVLNPVEHQLGVYLFFSFTFFSVSLSLSLFLLVLFSFIVLFLFLFLISIFVCDDVEEKYTYCMSSGQINSIKILVKHKKFLIIQEKKTACLLFRCFALGVDRR